MCCLVFFFVNDTATTEIYTYLHTLSLHDALPISLVGRQSALPAPNGTMFLAFIASASASSSAIVLGAVQPFASNSVRSEEHTSELQSLMRISYAVFCLKKKNT